MTFGCVRAKQSRPMSPMLESPSKVTRNWRWRSCELSGTKCVRVVPDHFIIYSQIDRSTVIFYELKMRSIVRLCSRLIPNRMHFDFIFRYQQVTVNEHFKWSRAEQVEQPKLKNDWISTSIKRRLIVPNGRHDVSFVRTIGNVISLQRWQCFKGCKCKCKTMKWCRKVTFKKRLNKVRLRKRRLVKGERKNDRDGGTSHANWIKFTSNTRIHQYIRNDAAEGVSRQKKNNRPSATWNTLWLEKKMKKKIAVQSLFRRRKISSVKTIKVVNEFRYDLSH